VDPLGGSFFVESLTDELEKKATDYIDRIESLGGVVSCIESGWIQGEIQNSAYQFQKDLESKKEIVVGVNDFIQEDGIRADVLKISEAVSKEQIERLKKYKTARDAKEVSAALAKLNKTAHGTENLMPVFIEAVECGATLGEISEELRKVFGLFKETITL
jgi:methylmalonyl-CoA mutase, N-terminal domain